MDLAYLASIYSSKNIYFLQIINKTEVPDSGIYSCIMSNKVGTTEVSFNVTIEKPPSIAGNTADNIVESHVVPLHRSVVLKCQADGNPPPKITWLKVHGTYYISIFYFIKTLSFIQLVWARKRRAA